MAAEECERCQHQTDAQCPVPQEAAELFHIELIFLGLQLTSMSGRIVVAEALGDDRARGALDHFKGVVASWLDDEARSKRRGNDVWLLVEVGSGLACTFA